MPIQLTDDQWVSVQQGGEAPVRVNTPADRSAFVLLPTEVYERFKALFEDDPVTAAERREHLQQFGRRAGWDPEMDVYDDRKLQLLLSLRLQELTALPGRPLPQVMDEIGAAAKTQGLTPQILDSLLHDE